MGVMTPFLNEEGTSELLSAIDFVTTYPGSMFDVVLFGVCGAIGQVFIFYTLERFGSLILVTVNVTRKMISMLLSVIWFNHVLTLGQWGSVALVFSGIGLEAMMSKSKKKRMMKEKEEAKNGNDTKLTAKPVEADTLRQRKQKEAH
jgi:UDP-galactose transporter B1